MTYLMRTDSGIIALLSGKESNSKECEEVYEMKGIRKITNKLMQNYMEYVKIAYCDQLR